MQHLCRSVCHELQTPLVHHHAALRNFITSGAYAHKGHRFLLSRPNESYLDLHLLSFGGLVRCRTSPQMSRFWFLGIAILIKILRHIVHYREPIWALAPKELKLRYKRSVVSDSTQDLRTSVTRRLTAVEVAYRL